MPIKTLPLRVAQEAIEAVEAQSGDVTAAAEDIGIPRSTLWHRLRVAKKLHGIEPVVDDPPLGKSQKKWEVTESGANIKNIWSDGDEVRSIQDALDKAEVDPAIWEVKDAVVNSYQVAMKLFGGYEEGRGRRIKDKPILKELWQVKVTLRRRAPKSLTDALELIHKRAEKFKPKYVLPKLPKPQGDLLCVLCLYDHHFGKLCWAEETGNNYDLKIAEKVWDNAAQDLLAYISPLGVKRFHVTLGQDFVNFDNTEGTTTAGTPQDNDGRYAKVIDTAYWAMVRLVDRLISIAPVDVQYVPGNHDLLASYHLSRELKRQYRSTDRVSVDIAYRSRKYYRWGKCLLGLAHANHTKNKWSTLPNLMATEVPQDWAATTLHEWLTGHVHSKTKRETLPVEEHDGVAVRTVPSLTATDAWHFEKGYFSKRAAEAYIYSAEKGYAGHFSADARE